LACVSIDFTATRGEFAEAAASLEMQRAEVEALAQLR